MFQISTGHAGKAVTNRDKSVNDIELSKREIEILRLILEGNSSKEAADILCCSKRTVDFYLGRVYDKLGVSNRIQAMRRINSLGLMSLVEDEKNS